MPLPTCQSEKSIPEKKGGMGINASDDDQEEAANFFAMQGKDKKENSSINIGKSNISNDSNTGKNNNKFKPGGPTKMPSSNMKLDYFLGKKVE